MINTLWITGCDKRTTPAPVRGEISTTSDAPLADRGPIQEEVIGQFEPQEVTPAVIPLKPRHNLIALLLPMSGQQKELGKMLQQAAEMAVFEKSDADLNLRVYDTQGTVAGAEQAARKALQDQAQIILGPVFADEVRAAAQVARSGHIQVLSFSNNKSVTGSGVFVLGFTPEEQIHAMALYLSRQDPKRVAALSPHNEYGQLFDRELKRISQQQSIPLVEIVHYNPNGSNLNRDLEALRTLSYDILFIPEGGATLTQIITHLHNKGLLTPNIQLVGTGQWDDVQTLQNPLLNKALLSGPDPQKRRLFEEKYQTNYGVAPNRLASLAYDAMCLLAALQKHFQDNPYALSSLTQPRGFDGVNGTFRLLQSGASQRKLAILEVVNGTIRVREPANQVF